MLFFGIDQRLDSREIGRSYVDQANNVSTMNVRFQYEADRVSMII